MTNEMNHYGTTTSKHSGDQDITKKTLKIEAKGRSVSDKETLSQTVIGNLKKMLKWCCT